jgi:hypothetical protein
MVLFELLQLVRVFLDYLRIEYLWHVLIMPLTNRNGIKSACGSERTSCKSGKEKGRTSTLRPFLSSSSAPYAVRYGPVIKMYGEVKPANVTEYV